MLFESSIQDVSTMSESLENINTSPLSDILHSIDQPILRKDLLADAGPLKAWHANSAELARCDLSEEHCHMFPKVGLRVMAVWRRSVKGPTLAEIKEDDEKIPLFASRVAHLIGSVLGQNLHAGGFAIVTTPRRRHKQRNFACLVAQDIARRLNIPYHEDVAIAKTKQRIGVDFAPGNIPPEYNLIVFDDFVTTGSTLGAMNRLLAPMGKNCIYFVGVNNQ